MSSQKYWLGLSLIPEIGPARIRLLRTHFGDLAHIWRASEADLRAAGLDGRPLKNVLEYRKKLDLDVELAKVNHAGAVLVTAQDELYPELLRDFPDSPPVLYVRGALSEMDSLAIAVVGTRKATHYGKDAAFRLSRQLASNGVTIVSGLAQGIDAAAHEGALKAGGRTIALLGCGIDLIYPRENLALAHRIIGQGAVVSEFPIGTPPSGVNFPRRNRTLSAMCLGVLVAEAPQQSGALITASNALEMGREVFAVPANIFNPIGQGCNKLIQDGAKLVMGVRDILDELDISFRQVTVQRQTERILPANPTEELIVRCLSADPIHIDDLTRQCGLSIEVVSSTLTILELKGLAKMVGPMQYCRQ